MAELSAERHAWQGRMGRRSTGSNQPGSGHGLAAQPALLRAVTRANKVAKGHLSHGCKVHATGGRRAMPSHAEPCQHVLRRAGPCRAALAALGSAPVCLPCAGCCRGGQPALINKAVMEHQGRGWQPGRLCALMRLCALAATT